jgi:DNA uptake protein ComE-like DNA-binding protein
MWIVWSFIPTLNWVAWLHAGIRTKRWIYFLYVALYNIPFTIGMLTADRPAYAKLEDFAAGLFAATWLICPIHALLIRNKVNREIEQVNPNMQRKIPVRPTATAAQTRSNANPGAAANPSQSAGQTTPPAGASLVDLNTTEESTLAALPGVGLILAKKAVSVRQEQGGFRSFDEFCDALGLQPHIREKLRPLVTIAASPASAAPAQQPPELGGRVVDY